MRMLNNRNVVQMKHCFYSNGDKPDEVYLNLVLEYVPDTVYRFCKQFTKNKEYMPLIYVKVRRNIYIYIYIATTAIIIIRRNTEEGKANKQIQQPNNEH